MKNTTLALSLLASLSMMSLSASALTQGASGLISMATTSSSTTAMVTGINSSSTDAVAVIQPMVHAPKVVMGKVSLMGSAINTIQPMLDAPVIN